MDVTWQLLGTVLVERYKRDKPVEEHVADIGMLSVSPDVQGAGIGGSLVAAGEEFARTHFGLTDAELWAFTTAELGRARVNWYSRLGYELTGEETTLQDLLPPWVKFEEAAALWTEVDEKGMPLQEGLTAPPFFPYATPDCSFYFTGVIRFEQQGLHCLLAAPLFFPFVTPRFAYMSPA